MILFINGCVRENSRTFALAQEVLSNLSGDVQQVSLYPDGPEGLTEQKLCLRDTLLAKNEFDDPMFRWAKQFAEAETIVIAAPYWDLMFPAKVRTYLEEITVSGITFRYGDDGIPRGLCRAKQLIYVTTAGGPIIWDLGFEYVEKLAGVFYGIPRILEIKAEGLDIWGADTEAILDAAKQSIPALVAPADDPPCPV